MESPLKKLKRERYQVCKQAFDGVINDLKSIKNPDPHTSGYSEHSIICFKT